MAAFIFTIAAGKWVRYSALPETADSFVWVLLQSDVEADATLRDRDSLQAIFDATGNTEAAFTGYSRVTAQAPTVTEDEANNAQDVDITVDPSWSPTSAQALGKILLVYKPDTGSADSAIIPVFADDFALTTPTSGTITYQVNAAGFATAVAS